MGLFPILIAAAAAKKSRARLRRRRNYSDSNITTESGYNSNFEYSYIDYLLRELEHGDSVELRDFLSKLFSYGKEIVEEYNDKVISTFNQQLETIRSEFKDYLVHFEEAEERLHQVNINLGGKTSSIDISSNSSSFDIYSTFNGVGADSFCTSSDNCEENIRRSDKLFEEKRKKLKEYADNIISLKEKKRMLISKEAELEKKIIIPFGREDNMKRLKEVREEISRVDKSIRRDVEEIERVQQYEKLTFEQKKAIIDYINARNELSKIQFKYDRLYYNRPNTYSRVHLTISNEVDVDLWFKALSRMFEREDIDLAYIDKVFDQIEKAPEKWCDRNLEMISSVSSSVNNYRQLLSFFLDYVYFPEYCDVLTKRLRYTDIQEAAAEEENENKKVKIKK